MNSIFDKFLSLKEAAELYNRDDSTLRRAIMSGRLKEGIDCKKYGKQWVVLKSAMDREYGVD